VNPFKVIKEPIISEKTTDLNNDLNQVVFKVDIKADKGQIKAAIQEIYPKTIVTKVRTSIFPGKLKKVRNQQGRTSSWKKAIVTLKEGCKIEFH
jgi:large subunit ribosomal protein L23